MKNYLFLLLFSAFIFQSCDDENPEPTPVSTELNHSGEPVDAPELPQGIYHAAAVFTADDLAGAAGDSIKEIEIYFVNRPSSLKFRVYNLDAGTPSTIPYSGTIDVDDIQLNSWYKHTLGVSYKTEGFAIAAVIEHNETMSSIGVDAGPANTNGDWLYLDATSEWTNLRDYTNNGTNANWSIRAKTGN